MPGRGRAQRRDDEVFMPLGLPTFVLCGVAGATLPKKQGGTGGGRYAPQERPGRLLPDGPTPKTNTTETSDAYPGHRGPMYTYT